MVLSRPLFALLLLVALSHSAVNAQTPEAPVNLNAGTGAGTNINVNPCKTQQ